MAAGLSSDFTTSGRQTIARYDRYALFGFFAHSAGRGERDFSSARGLAAEHYDVTVPDADEQRARALIAQLA